MATTTTAAKSPRLGPIVNRLTRHASTSSKLQWIYRRTPGEASRRALFLELQIGLSYAQCCAEKAAKLLDQHGGKCGCAECQAVHRILADVRDEPVPTDGTRSTKDARGRLTAAVAAAQTLPRMVSAEIVQQLGDIGYKVELVNTASAVLLEMLEKLLAESDLHSRHGRTLRQLHTLISPLAAGAACRT